MKDIQQKTDKDLAEFITEKREELRKIRFGTGGSAANDGYKIKVLRKDVARALTEFNARTKVSAVADDNA